MLTPNAGTVLENTVGGAMMSSSGMSGNKFDIVALLGLAIVPLVLLTISDPGRQAEGSLNAAKSQEAYEENRNREEKKGVLSSLTGCFMSDLSKDYDGGNISRRRGLVNDCFSGRALRTPFF